MTGQRQAWHIGKEVPLAMIFAIALQTIAAVWWAATITGRVDQQQRDIDSLMDSNRDRNVAIARMEERLNEVYRTTSRLEEGQNQTNNYLQSLFEKGPKR
jgi:predicted nuclease with TOPRIM domain